MSSLRNAHAIVVPSEFLTEQLLPLAPPDKRWFVAKNGARKLLYYPSREEERLSFRSKNKIPLDQKVIGFVGRLDHLKGKALLDDIASTLRNECLFLQYPAGDGGAELEANRKIYQENGELIAKKNPGVRLYPDFAPRIPDRPMRNFDVLIMPSLSEVAPMVVLEALASGVPVVATRSTHFFKDDLEDMGFDKSEVNVIDLPSQFEVGSQMAEFAPDELPKKGAELANALHEMQAPDDARRVSLSRKAELAGLTDQQMYSGFMDIYDAVLKGSVLEGNNSRRELSAVTGSGGRAVSSASPKT